MIVHGWRNTNELYGIPGTRPEHSNSDSRQSSSRDGLPAEDTCEAEDDPHVALWDAQPRDRRDPASTSEIHRPIQRSRLSSEPHDRPTFLLDLSRCAWSCQTDFGSLHCHTPIRWCDRRHEDDTADSLLDQVRVARSVALEIEACDASAPQRTPTTPSNNHANSTHTRRSGCNS